VALKTWYSSEQGNKQGSWEFQQQPAYGFKPSTCRWLLRWATRDFKCYSSCI